MTGVQTFEEITTGKGPDVKDQPAVTYKPIDASKQKSSGAGKGKAGKAGDGEK